MKNFHISDVLSVTTPFLLSTRHVDGVYDILGFLCGEPGGVFTHQLPRVAREAEPWLRTQFPQLMEDSPEMVPLIEQFRKNIEAIDVDRSKVCEDFVESVRLKFGLPEYLPVYEKPSEQHTRIDPVEELKAMVGDDKVVKPSCRNSVTTGQRWTPKRQNGVKMSQPICSHCGGLHYGSVPGDCPYVCDICHCDIRPDAMPRCACPPKPQSPGFFEKQREMQEALAENYRLVGKNSGVGMIVDERLRQIRVEGWTPEHDDEHDFQELSKAALCYADYAVLVNLQGHEESTFWEEHIPAWPWNPEWWKPSPDPIRNLVKAGALIAAEIDRLQRKAETDRVALEEHHKKVALDELLKQPTSDPDNLVRCQWCGQEMPKPHPPITTPVCLDCIPF